MSTPTPTPGRRSATSRRTAVNLTTVLAVVLPVLSLVALLLVRDDDQVVTTHPPTETTLSSATLVCPGPLGDEPGLAVTTAADDVQGQVQVGFGDDATDAEVATGRVTTVDAATSTAVTGSGDTAPGLVAGRISGSELAATACLPPAAHQWFTGVGAGAGHRSVLELTNPDTGTALADVTVLGGTGVVDAPRLRGVSVPGHSTVRLDLGQLVPRRGELALDVLTVRGRIGASVLDSFDRAGSAPLTRDWLPGQAEPETRSLLMGLAPGAGPRTLVIANGGDDEARASLKVVTPTSAFVPEGFHEVRIPPQTVKRITLSSALAEAIDKDALGLAVTASAPVTTVLRSQVSGDLSYAVPGVAVSDPATALLPLGSDRGDEATTKTLDLAGAVRAGTVTVESRAADGTRLDSSEVEITPGHGVGVELPATAVLVTVTSARTSVTGAVLVSRRDGATVVPLVVPVTSGLVPAVRPGLP